jgi:hypothetical protein
MGQDGCLSVCAHSHWLTESLPLTQSGSPTSATFPLPLLGPRVRPSRQPRAQRARPVGHAWRGGDADIDRDANGMVIGVQTK